MITHNGQTYKVVIVTPAGREEYLSFFKKFIYKKMEDGLVDIWQLWQNTVKQSDIDYLASMEAENSKVIRCFLPGGELVPTYNNCDPMRSFEFFNRDAQSDDSIYIRFDDDIVWVEEGAIEKMCIARIEHPEAYLIYPNVINSTTVSQWHQDIGAIGKEAGDLSVMGSLFPNPEDPNHIYLNDFAYTDPGFIDLIHDTFKSRYAEGTLSAYYLPSRLLDKYERFSICSVCFFGKDHIHVDPLEEQSLAWEGPEKAGRPVWFCGDALVVHFSYHTQVDHLRADRPDLLEFYKNLALTKYI